MDKRLKITEIAARTQLSISTVSRVLAGKANTSEKARAKVLACARELGVLDGMAARRLLLNSLVVFAPQRAFDERSDIFYYRVIQSVSKALASHEVRLRYCALEENDSDAQLFLARMNEPDTQAAILLGIDDPHIHDLAVDVGKPCMLINCRDRHMRLPAVAPDHRAIGERAAEYLFEMGTCCAWLHDGAVGGSATICSTTSAICWWCRASAPRALPAALSQHGAATRSLLVATAAAPITTKPRPARAATINDGFAGGDSGVPLSARDELGTEATGHRLADPHAAETLVCGNLPRFWWGRLYGGGHHQRQKRHRRIFR